MLGRLYKVIDEEGQTKYFENGDERNANNPHGKFVTCYRDTQKSTWHEIQFKYSGNKHDELKSIKKGSQYYGGGESLSVSNIKGLFTGVYPACLHTIISGDDEYSSGNATLSIKLDQSTGFYPQETEESQHFWDKTTYGLVLHIEDHSYTLYKKINQVYPESFNSQKHTKFSFYQENNLSHFFSSVPKLDDPKLIELTTEEKQYLSNKVQEAHEKAMENIKAARLTNNSVTLNFK